MAGQRLDQFLDELLLGCHQLLGEIEKLIGEFAGLRQ
jgi:hypothetical protein